MILNMIEASLSRHLCQNNQNPPCRVKAYSQMVVQGIFSNTDGGRLANPVSAWALVSSGSPCGAWVTRHPVDAVCFPVTVLIREQEG